MTVGGISRIAKSIRVSTKYQPRYELSCACRSRGEKHPLWGICDLDVSLEFDLPYSRTTAVDGRRVTGLYGDGYAVHRTVHMVQDPQRYGYGIRRRCPWPVVNGAGAQPYRNFNLKRKRRVHPFSYTVSNPTINPWFVRWALLGRLNSVLVRRSLFAFVNCVGVRSSSVFHKWSISLVPTQIMFVIPNAVPWSHTHATPNWRTTNDEWVIGSPY